MGCNTRTGAFKHTNLLVWWWEHPPLNGMPPAHPRASQTPLHLFPHGAAEWKVGLCMHENVSARQLLRVRNRQGMVLLLIPATDIATAGRPPRAPAPPPLHTAEEREKTSPEAMCPKTFAPAPRRDGAR